MAGEIGEPCINDSDCNSGNCEGNICVAAHVYYVRPSGGNYSSENGSSYETAWDGFSNINWSKIKPGDKLYVCGDFFKTSSSTSMELEINASGQPGKLIEIKGDCNSLSPSYENGRIWAGLRINTSQWDGRKKLLKL